MLSENLPSSLVPVGFGLSHVLKQLLQASATMRHVYTLDLYIYMYIHTFHRWEHGLTCDLEIFMVSLKTVQSTV